MDSQPACWVPSHPRNLVRFWICPKMPLPGLVSSYVFQGIIISTPRCHLVGSHPILCTFVAVHSSPTRLGTFQAAWRLCTIQRGSQGLDICRLQHRLPPRWKEERSFSRRSQKSSPVSTSTGGARRREGPQHRMLPQQWGCQNRKGRNGFSPGQDFVLL